MKYLYLLLLLCLVGCTSPRYKVGDDVWCNPQVIVNGSQGVHVTLKASGNAHMTVETGGSGISEITQGRERGVIKSVDYVYKVGWKYAVEVKDQNGTEYAEVDIYEQNLIKRVPPSKSVLREHDDIESTFSKLEVSNGSR